MFPQTCNVIKEDKIIPFSDPNATGNKALFLMIAPQVDEYFQPAIKHEGFGDKARLFICQRCASIDEADKHHFHQLFMSL
jgi:hypothetical protein